MPLSTLQEFIGDNVDYTIKVHPDWYRDTDAETIKNSRILPSRAVYLLDDPLNVDQFVADNKGKVGDYQILNANNDTFKKMARPLDTMSFFANIVVWIVVVNAVVIISLVTALTLKTREYEIGVMLSIGVSKAMVVVQLFLELMLIAILGFALASVSGSLAAGRVGEMVLDFQTTSEAQYGENNTENYFSSSSDYFTQVTQDELLSEYHVTVSPLLIGEIFLLGTGVVLIATLIPSLMIMRLNVKQILLS
jgi:ABC-type antimicrobial peptide transport system permease subunit